MLRIPFQSTIFSVVFLAFFLANVYLLQSMTLGIILLIVFLVVSADHLGTTVASQEHGPLRWVMGCLLLISGLMLIPPVAYYVRMSISPEINRRHPITQRNGPCSCDA